MKKWLSVILSAVVLGLSVSYILKKWMPVEVADWILVVVAALIAIRSVVRIAQLANEKGEEDAEEQE